MSNTGKALYKSSPLTRYTKSRNLMKKHVNPSKYCLKKKSFALLTVVFLAKQPWAGNSTLIAKPLSASEFRLHASLQAKS